MQTVENYPFIIAKHPPICFSICLWLSAMYIIYRDKEGSTFNHPAEAIMGMFMMSLGEFGDFYDSFDETKHQILAIVWCGTVMLCYPTHSDVVLTLSWLDLLTMFLFVLLSCYLLYFDYYFAFL